MAKKCKIYEVKYDSSVNIFETLFKTVYSENLSFPETKKYEFYCPSSKLRRYYIKSEFSYNGKKSVNMQFSGDIDLTTMMDESGYTTVLCKFLI